MQAIDPTPTSLLQRVEREESCAFPAKLGCPHGLEACMNMHTDSPRPPPVLYVARLGLRIKVVDPTDQSIVRQICAIERHRPLANIVCNGGVQNLRRWNFKILGCRG